MKIVAAVAMLAAACADPRVRPVACDGGDCTASVHPPGIADPASADFHGALLRQLDWDFATCQQCHGADYRGGTSGVSCVSCHADGPTACTTCHGSGPTSNAHAAHAGASVACGECHVVPARWDDDGHILHDGVAITAPPRIVFGARAQTTLVAADRAGPPAWDGATCTNVYCHGAVLHAAGGTATAPRWDDPAPVGTCTRCHGAPPPSHARSDCATCHPPGAPHVDGVVQVGRTAGCSGCHGSPASPAPPTDLAGNTHTTAIGVGAHQAHLQAPERISAPVPCDACHAVPVAVDDPGHIDHAGPAIVTASLGWDRTAQTCATAWCHGPARPIWTQSTHVACGDCHGLPPADAAHAPDLTIASCATCHPGTVDGNGNILVPGEHLNGHVDHQ